MIELLAQITGRKKNKPFTASIVLWDNKVIEAAPIVKFMLGWSRADVRVHCQQARWKISVVTKTERTEPWPGAGQS